MSIKSFQCITCVIYNIIKNSHTSVERIVTPAEGDIVSICQSYIPIFPAFMQTNPNNHPSEMDSSIIHISHTNICFRRARKTSCCFPKVLFTAAGLIHHGCNKDNELPASQHPSQQPSSLTKASTRSQWSTIKAIFLLMTMQCTRRTNKRWNNWTKVVNLVKITKG